MHISQAAKGIRASQETLIDIFEHIQNFFHHLEVSTTVALMPEMVDIMVKIMVEVLAILGIATKKIKQGCTSEKFYTKIPSLTENYSEKYLKSLAGRTYLEDALKKLDMLTWEEV